MPPGAPVNHSAPMPLVGVWGFIAFLPQSRAWIFPFQRTGSGGATQPATDDSVRNPGCSFPSAQRAPRSPRARRMVYRARAS